MKLASFKVNGRASYGAVTGNGGIIDLARRLSKYPTLLDVFRAGAIGEARAAATGQPDHRLPPAGGPPPPARPRGDAAATAGARKDHLRRHQLPGARHRIQGSGGCREAQISEPVLPF